MKKVISSLLVMSMVFCASIAKADNLTVEQAKTVGCYYLAQQTGIDKLVPEDLVLAYQFENPDMDAASAYLFNMRNNCGWVIVAATTVMDPIVAFSEVGSLDMDNIPDNLRWWLNGYTADISEIQLMDAENDYPDCVQYTDIIKMGTKNGTKDQKIILMGTTWDQGDNYHPTYNLYCPVINGRYSVTGCVATAISQMFNYYKYPVKPKGTVSVTCNGTNYKVKLDTVTFDYSLMPNYLSSSSTSEQIHQVAMLNYCVGLASDMDYSPDGSGAAMGSQSFVSAMKMKFKYQYPSLRMRNGNSDTNFVFTLRRHLMKNDVVAMRGESSSGGGADAAGHAWVACGYMAQDTSKYYMNWGWGGSGNGFFNFLANTSIRPNGTGYNFNQSQGLLLNLLPPEDSNIHHDHVAIREVVDNTVLGTAYPNPATLSVTIPYTTEAAADLQVFSIDGKMVATKRVQAGSGNMTLRVDALPKGVYIYRLNGVSAKFIVK